VLRFLATLVLLAALLAGADLAATWVAEQRAAEQVSSVLEAPADVDLRGWPVSYHLVVNGRVPRAHITATDVPLAEGATAERVVIDLEGVAVRWRDLTGEVERLPNADEGWFETELEAPSVQAMLGLPEQVVGVGFEGGVAVLSLVDLVEVEADITARDGLLVLVPRAEVAELLGVGEVPIDLSGQPGSPQVHEATVDGDRLVLRGMLADLHG
jgi:hypothetical protein